MNSQENYHFMLKISCVISSLLKKWKTIVVVMLFCGIALDVFSTLTYHKQYASTLTAVLDSGENSYADLENARGYIKTLDYIFNGQVVKKYLREQLKDKDFDMTCHISSVNDTNVVRIQVISDTKKNAYYSLENITSWYKNNTKRYHFDYQLETIEEAQLNEMPMNQNNHFANFKTGALYSGMLLIVIIGIQAYLKDTIKIPKDIESHIDCRLFAKIPKEKKPGSKKFWKKKKQAILISSLKTSFFYKESIKKLRSKVEESAKKHGYQSLMITSSLENEGKSSIAANLALALVQNHYKVLLIDADMRKPSLHKIFELATQKKINQYLQGQKTWESQVEYIQKHDLFVMCAKQDLEHAEDMVRSDKMRELIEKAKKEFDFVIVDSSPAFYINEPIILNEYVDASLLVLKQNLAVTSVINETIGRLVNAKNNLIGCVYNASVIDIIKKQKTYGYRYGYNRYKRERGE